MLEGMSDDSLGREVAVDDQVPPSISVRVRPFVSRAMEKNAMRGAYFPGLLLRNPP
jgi:hypothetical protein